MSHLSSQATRCQARTVLQFIIELLLPLLLLQKVPTDSSPLLPEPSILPLNWASTTALPPPPVPKAASLKKM